MQRFRLFWDHWHAFSMRFSGYHHDSALALIIGSFYPCVYYGFYCEPHYKIGYMLLITLAGLGAWPSLNHARHHNFFFFRSGCIHCFEPRI
jgi:predicted membrane channel-forming protein YqfA (hemolysin III family)